MDAIRITALVAVSIVLFIMLLVFIDLFLRVAAVLALLALAYYWFSRATAHRRGRSKDWR